MSKVIKIRKGKDIKLKGESPLQWKGEIISDSYAIKPPDFQGLVPKLAVKEGDEVKAGTPLFFDKSNSSIKFTSPVSGEVTDIVRGDRRAVLEIRVLADKETKYEVFSTESADAEKSKEILLSSGLWPALRQRPFNIMADPDETPKGIFISGFDSAPLAADLNFLLADQKANLQKGIEVLSTITGAPIHLSLKNGADNSTFEGLNGVNYHYFSGPHPAGVVGIQIHHIDPINKGDIVWTVGAADLAQIGELFNTGKYNAEKGICLTGSEVTEPGYYKVKTGVAVKDLVNGRITEGNNRIISGNVFVGTKVNADGYLSYYDTMVTIIPEGDQYEFLGWLIPSYPRPSLSKSFPYYLMPNKEYRVNTNLHGEERAFVVTGEYDKVLPMDIMPVYLLKAILAQDLEAMENLGIYEVVEEDMALCEFACTSKIHVQEILREGLDLMESEG